MLGRSVRVRQTGWRRGSREQPRMGVFLGVLVLSRMVSAGSVCAAAALGIAVLCFDYSLPVEIVTGLVALLVILKHRSNIARILKGEESKIFSGKSA